MAYETNQTVGEDVIFLSVTPLTVSNVIEHFNSEDKISNGFTNLLLTRLKEHQPLLPSIGLIGMMAGGGLNNWFLGFSGEFKKDIDNVDRKLQGRVLEAMAEIVDAPMTVKGDTIKPLTKEEKFAGCWRYRIGDYRLIYHPNGNAKQITLVAFEPRAGVY